MSAGRLAGVPRKYATSLYTAAQRVNKLDAVEKDMKTVKDLYASNKSFAVRLQANILEAGVNANAAFRRLSRIQL